MMAGNVKFAHLLSVSCISRALNCQTTIYNEPSRLKSCKTLRNLCATRSVNISNCAFLGTSSAERPTQACRYLLIVIEPLNTCCHGQPDPAAPQALFFLRAKGLALPAGLRLGGAGAASGSTRSMASRRVGALTRLHDVATLLNTGQWVQVAGRALVMDIMSELGPFQASVWGPNDWLLQGGTGSGRIITKESIWKAAKGHSGALARRRAGAGRLGGRGAARRAERRRRLLLAVILVGVHLQSFARHRHLQNL